MNQRQLKRLENLRNYFKNKTTVVTGATAGIGHSTAMMLSRLGGHVVILARTPSDLEKTLKDLDQVKALPLQKFKSFQVDLRNVQDVLEVSKKIQKDFRVDFLINNAGVYFTNYFTHQTPDQIQSMILTNIMAPLQLTRAFIPHFIENGFGHVVNLSSLAAKLNFTGYGVYGGTKAGLSHSTKGLNFELSPKNIYFSDFFAPDSLTRGYEEELKTMPTETKKINGTVKPLSSDDVALSLLEGIRDRKLEIIPGAKSKTISFLAKHLPQSVTDSLLRTLSR